MSQENCFEKLEQLIIDEKRIVTYKILSREMKIHVNKAKEYLNLYYEKKKNDPNTYVFAHYFLTGFIQKEKEEFIKVLIIPEDKLEKSKLEFQEITSLHLYSVSRRNVQDECAMYAAEIPYNKNPDEVKKYSAIKHSNIGIQAPTLKVDFVKTEAKINGSKTQNVSLSNGNLNHVSKENEDKVEKNVLTVKSNEKVSSGSANTISSDMKGKISTENSKKNTLTSLWQKKEETSSNAQKKISKSEDKTKKGTVKNPGKNSIMNMFSKQAEKNVLSGLKSNSPSSAPEETVIPKVETVKKSPLTTSKESGSQNTKSSQKRKSSKRQPSKKSKQQSNSDSEEERQPKKKKHRRICTFEDSDSESENEEMQDKAQRNFHNLPEEILTKTAESDDSEDPIPPTPPVHNAAKIKGKVWKTVQKTYQDDDGFFVTKKEKELVTASEDSDEDPLKKINVKVAPAKNSPSKTVFTAKKQASLTSFFNKK